MAGTAFAQERKVFANSVVPLPAREGFSAQGFNVQALVPENKQDKLEIQVSLETPNISDLQARVSKGEIIPEAEMEKNYRPKVSDYDGIVRWLKEQGFEITQTTSERNSVYARGTIQQIEKAFQVKMAKVTVDGRTYNAAETAPSLPTNIGAHVLGINGLQPFLRAHKHIVAIAPKDAEGVARSADSPPDQAKLTPQDTTLTANMANKPPYSVHEITAAYHAIGLGLTGVGEKIAILIDTFPADSDLAEFWKRNKLNVKPQQIEKIKVGDGKLPSREGEETLDVEWSAGIAPGAAVRVYATCSLSFVAIDKALDRILADLPSQPGLHQLSISLGLGETFLAIDEVNVERDKFAKLAARGVNVFVSSGDAGSNPDESGHSSTGPLQVEYESSDPFVIAVGGTTLNLNASGQVDTETGWAGGGGGMSKIFDRPAWQKGMGIVPGKMRLVPDVSLVADPSTGALLVYDGDVQMVGGTSWSAPAWAGFCALINEGRNKVSKPPLSFLSPLIYPLINNKGFRDITAGNNGAFSAAIGYDMVTGVGVPDIGELATALQ
jgi:kumamolisin